MAKLEHSLLPIFLAAFLYCIQTNLHDFQRAPSNLHESNTAQPYFACLFLLLFYRYL